MHQNGKPSLRVLSSNQLVQRKLNICLFSSGQHQTAGRGGGLHFRDVPIKQKKTSTNKSTTYESFEGFSFDPVVELAPAPPVELSPSAPDEASFFWAISAVSFVIRAASASILAISA